VGFTVGALYGERDVRSKAETVGMATLDDRWVTAMLWYKMGYKIVPDI
jgi:hypothetical protein